MEKAEEGMMESLLQRSADHEIVCPVCLRARARLIKEGGTSYITCTCGLKYPLPNHITLNDFESALVACAELHHLSCPAVPQHHVRNSGSSLQFAFSCESCETISIIFEWPQHHLPTSS